MKLLVTGGTGFIGSAFVKKYPDYDYTILTRHPARHAQLLSGHTAIDSLDTLDSLDGFDGVINLCGESIAAGRWSAARKRKLESSRYEPTARLVQLLQRSERAPAVMISGSAIGVYGNGGNQPLDESLAPRGESYDRQLCQRWESIAAPATNHTRLVLARTGVVLGNQGGALPRMLMPYRIGLGGRLGDGQQYFSWIHIDDMLEALHYALRQPDLHGAVNFTAPEPLRNAELSQLFCERLATRERLNLPARLLELGLGEAANLLLGSQRVVPSKLSRAGFNWRFPTAGQALDDLLRE